MYFLVDKNVKLPQPYQSIMAIRIFSFNNHKLISLNPLNRNIDKSLTIYPLAGELINLERRVFTMQCNNIVVIDYQMKYGIIYPPPTSQ